MKKLIFIILAAGFAFSSFAQQMSIGPKAGVNFSNLTNADKSESITGITAGGFFVYSIVEHFGVSADLLYSVEGAKYSYQQSINNAVVETESKLCLNYIRIPLLANVFFGQLGDKLRPKISLGPSFGILTGVKNTASVTTIDNGSTEVSESESTDKSGYSSFDLSAIVGAGLNYRVGEKTWLNLDARYSIGTTDINEIKLQDDEAVKNTGFSVALGLAFGLD